MAVPELSSESFSTQAIDHLGLVADQIDQLGLIDLIDNRLPIQGAGSKISMGERVAGIILNGLGFIDTRLYLFPDFFTKKPLSRLFGREIDAAWFNDDSLGRCLDAISGYGITKLFTELSFSIAKNKKLLGKSAHFDTTSLQVEGDYANYADDCGSQATPAHGYSKSHRFDLKQMILNLATTGKSNFPIWMEAHSGNSSDKKILPTAIAKMNALCQQLKEAESFLYVADSAVYENILQHSEKLKWLSRVPSTIGVAKKLISRLDSTLDWFNLSNGYQCHIELIEYGGIKQRWALIFSEQAYNREIKTLVKQIAKAQESLNKTWWHLSNQIFKSEDDAIKAAKLLERKMQYHKVTYQIIEIKKNERKGRPAKNTQLKTVGYKVEYTLLEDIEKIDSMKKTKGRFILATNELDALVLSDSEILTEYKAQSGVERGFKFIKDNSFQVDSIFLKTPHRIEALMMLMTLCLMVFGLTQYQIREALVLNNETLPDQRRKPTQKPSLKWIFFLFLGVQEITINLEGEIKQMVSNVNDLLKKIISYCGPRAKSIYLNPSTL